MANTRREPRIGRARLTTAILAAIVLGTAVASPASAGESPLVELARYNPGISVAELDAALRDAAAEQGLSYEAVLEQALAEARSSVAVVSRARGAVTASKGGGTGNAYLGTGIKGDIFHSYASTLGVQHNHTGIFYLSNYTIEATGIGEVSRVLYSPTRLLAKPIRKMWVSGVGGSSGWNAAADYAYNNLLGKSYDVNFVTNRSSGDGALNCSELVWKAYKRTTGIDLDANGGLGVYPNDILNHSATIVYETIS